MKTSQMYRRLEKLSTKIRPGGVREFTLEELCRQHWRMDKRGFLALTRNDFTGLHVFAEAFENEDAERARRAAVSARR